MSNSVDIGRLMATLGLNTAPFTAGMQQAQSQMQAANKVVAATGAKMAKVGQVMNRALTLPMALAGTATVKLAADFEASMAKITGLVGVSKDQVEAWKSTVLAMAPVVGQGADKLAEALFFITSAGLRGAEAMEVLEMAAKAATSGLGEVKVVADLVTSAMNAYGKDNLSAAQATDILTAAVREGKAEADELAGAMGMVLPIASAFGVSFNEVGAAFAAMTRTGTNARVAATQLKAILSSMAAPSRQAEEALQKYGTSAENFRKSIVNKGLIGAMLDLREATKGNAQAMAEIFPNIRGLMGTLDLLGANMAENVEIFKAMKDPTGALDAAFQSASETIKFKFAKALSTLKTHAITYGTTLSGQLIPLLEKVTEIIARATERWNKLSDAQKENRIKIAAITAAMGPLLMISGKLMKVIGANPYIALAAAIVGAVAATVKFAKANKELFDSYDAVESANKRINKLYLEQSTNVRSLVRAIENENLSNGARTAAIEKLKKLMPEYNGYISKEGELINHNVEAINKYLHALRAKIRIQVFQEEYTKALKKQLEVEEKLTKAIVNKSIALATGKGVGFFTARTLRLEKQLKNTKQAVEDLDNKAQSLNITLGALDADTTTTNTVVTEQTGKDSTGFGESGVAVIEKTAEASIIAAEGLADMNQHLLIASDSLNNFANISFEPLNNELTTIGELLKDTNFKAYALSSAVMGIGEAMGGMIADQQGAMKAFFGSVLDGIGNIINALFAQAVAAIIAKEATTKGLVGLGAAVIGVGALKRIWAKYVPEFAEGGIISGPTIGMMGEYPGARSNPEVVAPLDKLKSLIQQPQKNTSEFPKLIELKLKGRDAVALVDFNRLLDNTY